MKIAFVSIIKPMKGSGDGITEYAFNIYKEISKKNRVDIVYATERSKKNDIKSLLYANTVFKKKIIKLAHCDYDLIHLLNHEVGFASKIIKSIKPDLKVVTTVHDYARFQKGFQKGLLQSSYNILVKRSINDAIKFSDYLIFDSAQILRETDGFFGKGINRSVVPLGIDRRMLSPVRKKKIRGESFVIGYVGALSYHKNVKFAINAVNKIEDKDILFKIYGKKSHQFEELRKLAQSNKRIRFMGYVPEDKLVSTYDSLDVLIHPILYTGFELEILEAQSRGVPVITYKHAKIPKEVKRYCIEANNEEHAAEIIKNLKDNGYDEEKRKKAMLYARSFTWEKTAKETMMVYKKIIK